MICSDTTVLMDEFRAAGNPSAPVNRALLAYGSETLVVPSIAAGEFLDGAAMISEERMQQALRVLKAAHETSSFTTIVGFLFELT
jgi:predicted nucleic acid-binding protein